MTKIFLPLILAFASVLSSCGSGIRGETDISSLPPPSDATARFKQLAQSYDQARFHVVYQLDRHVGDDQGQLSWMKSEAGSRWDQVTVRDDQLFGDTVFQPNGSRAQCVWMIERGSGTASVRCWSIDFDYRDYLLSGFFSFPFPVQFSRYRTVIGIQTECYYDDAGPAVGEICLSPEGIPLAVDSSLGQGGQGMAYSLTAIEVRPPPSDADLRASLAPDLQPDTPGRTFDLAQLSLPSVPLVSAFLDAGG